jgi:hypothetical protein
MNKRSPLERFGELIALLLSRGLKGNGSTQT